jgi:hypothetical protein
MTRRVRIEHRPLSRARQPSYPSFEDPRPTDVGARDTSLAARAARHLVTVSLGVALPVGAAHAGSGRVAKPSSTVKESPFSAKNGGFPIHPIRYGTGQPSRLSETDARAAIERVFRKAGVRLKRDVDPGLKNVVVKLDGWEAKRRIGYEYVHWGDYEYGARWGGTAKASGLSFVEIKDLDKLAASGKAYVAAINHRRYGYGRYAVYSDKRYRAKSKQLRAAKTPAKRKQLQAELRQLSDQLTKQGKTVAIRRLESDVRRFISWLRGQGAL